MIICVSKKDMQRVLPLLVMMLMGLISCATGRSSESTQTKEIMDQADEIYREAEAAYEKGDYHEALIKFQEIIHRYPGSLLLSDAQWMVARTEERRGQWKRALMQYKSFTFNYPQSKYVKEARRRILLIRELENEVPQRKIYPLLKGIEVKNIKKVMESIDQHEALGINTILIQLDDSVAGFTADDILFLQRKGLLVYALIRMDFRELFSLDARDDFKRLSIKIGILGLDGLLIEGNNRTASEWLQVDIINQFNRDFGTEAVPDDFRKDARLYWRWAGWKGRSIIKRLEEVVRPIKNTQRKFYWGIIFPEVAITRPHIALSRHGVDLLEAKASSLDYFVIDQEGRNHDRGVLEKALDLIGEPTRIISVAKIPPAGINWTEPEGSKVGILYLNHAVGNH